MKQLLLYLGLFMGAFVSCQKGNQPLEKKEQNLRINLQKEPISLDPRKGNDMVASQVHFMLFEGLLRLNPDMSISPAQAKTFEVSQDKRTYTFYLQNTLWSDGTPVTAYDFETSWKSILDPKFPCPDAFLLYCIKNAKSAKKGEVPLDAVGVHAQDATTLIVELERPSPHFLQVVASSVMLPVNPRVDSQDPNWAFSQKSFVSNGPFKLKDWKINHEMTLEKSPLFRNADEVKLDHVIIDIIDRELAALSMYVSGHFDLIGTPLSFFPTIINQDLEKKNLLEFFPVATTKFLSFNTAKFPFDNANMRKAFAYAISRKDIVEHITQLKEQEASNIIPPVFLKEGARHLFNDDDVGKAKEYFQKGLKELNIQPKDIGKLSFIYVSGELNHLMSQELQNRWLQILGINVNLENVEFKTLHERSRKGEYALGLFTWVADYGDPMSILERFQDRFNLRNYPKWENQEFNRNLEYALDSSSPQEYMHYIKKAEQIMVDEMPISTLYHGNYAFLIHPHVKGFEISPLGHIYFEKISIDSSKKNR